MAARDFSFNIKKTTFLLLSLALVALTTSSDSVWAIKETEGYSQPLMYVAVVQQSVIYRNTLSTRWYGADEQVLLASTPSDSSALRLAKGELEETLESWRQPYTILSSKVLSHKFDRFLGGAGGTLHSVSLAEFSAEVDTAFLTTRTNLQSMDNKPVRYLRAERVMLRLHNEDNESVAAEFELNAELHGLNTLNLNILSEPEAVQMARAWRKLQKDQSFLRRILFRTPALSIWVESTGVYGTPMQWLVEAPEHLKELEAIIKNEAKTCEERLESPGAS